MSLAGPRLDRLSAVGEEGRPRTTSLTIVSLAVVGLVGVGGFVLDQPDLALVLGALAGTTAAGMALLDRERLIHLVAGHCLLVWFGSPLALLVVGAPLVGLPGLAVSGFALALLGLGATWTDAGDSGGLKRTVAAAAMTYLGMIFWLAALGGLAAVVALSWLILSTLSGQSGPGASTVGFLFVLGATAAGVVLSLPWLPILQLSPRRDRDTVARRIEAIRRVARRTAVVAVVSLPWAGLAWALGGFDVLADTAPGVADALGVLSSPFVLVTVAAPGAAFVVSGLLALALRAGTRRFDPSSAGRLAALIAGLSLAVGVAVGVVLAGVAPAVGLGAITVAFAGPVVLGFTTAVCLLGIALEVVPDRAWGPALAASGLVVAAIGTSTGPAPFTFACVAGALLVWDLSAFGLGVTAELGHLPRTRRLELFHGLIAVAVGAGAVLVVTGLEVLRTSLVAWTGGVPALIVASIGVLVLLVPLRG